MINGRNVFDHPIKNCLKTHNSIRKRAIDQCDN